MEKLDSKFYYKLYSNGEDGIRFCGSIGGPYTLRLYEFTLSETEDQYVKELVYALPKSIVALEKKEETRRKKEEERKKKGKMPWDFSSDDEEEEEDKEKEEKAKGNNEKK